MVISIKTTIPGYSMKIKCAVPELLKYSLCKRSLFFCLNRTAFAYGKKLYSGWCFITVVDPSLPHNSKKLAWSIRSSADGGGVFNPFTRTSDPSSGTRLNRAVRAIQTNLSSKVKEIRKHFGTKLLFFLVGFYCATAFATVIGQTGDWDILSAALAVVIVEGIGALMYKAGYIIHIRVMLAYTTRRLKRFRLLEAQRKQWLMLLNVAECRVSSFLSHVGCDGYTERCICRKKEEIFVQMYWCISISLDKERAGL